MTESKDLSDLLFLLRHYYGGTKIRARTLNGLLSKLKSFSITEKRRMRFFYTCICLNKLVKQNWRIVNAYKTDREVRAGRARVKTRARFVREGKVKRNDGTHIHHIDGNPFNNKDSNLQIINGRAHKHAHTHRHQAADANCAQFIKTLKRDLLLKRKIARYSTIAGRILRKLRRAI